MSEQLGSIWKETIMKYVYLCVTHEGYCHAVFSNRIAAIHWCQSHPMYYVIERELYRTSYDID